MADKASSKRKSFGRSASTESTEYSLSMGRSVRRRKPKERWLLTRKTWKYMADAGRKLIPDGAKNCVEDIPKIEAHFQEICKKEPKFLLWRKNSYPGAIGLRKKKKHASRKGGSCRKAISEGEVDVLKPERPKDLILEPKVQGKFDLKKMREDFLNSPAATPTGGFKDSPSTSTSPDQADHNDLEENHLVSMLEQYLRLANTPDALKTGSGEFNYQELLKKLQTHLSLASNRSSHTPTDYSYTRGSNLSPHSKYNQQHHVSFQGDHVQRSLSDTLSRYFGAYPNRDKVISDLLTDRKALEKLYFELRKAKGFRGSRGGTGYSTGGYDSTCRSYGNSKHINGQYGDDTFPRHPPPLIEVESETVEITYKDRGTQTLPIAESVLVECENEFKKKQAEEEEEKNYKEKEHRVRRRSSVDNDDVSQSVSDTIKRYLRMARKKSVDADKAVGFKRVNYDRNLRYIKAKGEITKPGDDDGLNKGCQTNDDWILTYRETKMADVYDVSDESRVSSARSSIDIGVFDRDGVKSSPSSPPSGKSGSHGFLSHLLHGGKHDNKHQDKDLLTDRKALEKLNFELRKAKGFRSSRGGTGYSTGGYDSTCRSYGNSKHINGQYGDDTFPRHPPPLIEVESETVEITYKDRGTQRLPIAKSVLVECENEFKKKQAEEEEEKNYKEKEHRVRRRSSVDNDDVSQSVSDTIKRYLRMARKKSVDADKAVGFKRVNYDRNLRYIKAKGEITKPGDDDGLNKGCQTNDDWILTYRETKMADVYDVSDESRVSSARSSIDIGVFDRDGVKSSPSSPPSGKSGSHGFLSHLLHGGKHDNKHQDKAVTATAMQKSKSSSSVMQQGSLVAKKIFRSRSKSQTRPAQTPCSWMNRGSCVWNSVTGRQVILQDTNLLHLTEVERQVLQKVAIAKLQALNLGVSIKVPTENVGVVPTKKRRPYLLKRKALTTGIFDTNRKDGDKDGNTTGGLVFGIPLTQCVENDRLRGVCRSDLSSPEERSNMKRHGSRASFSSLIDAPRGDETGSCESLMGRERIVGSVPGLLDRLSCSSAADIPSAINEDETGAVPNILAECIRHLENHGLHTFGIFRVSASKKRLRQLREDFDCGKETTIDDSQCPHDVASLLKEYLRDLPDPLLCRDLYHAFIHTQRIRNRRLQLEALQHLVQLLPPANRDTLYSLLSFLADVAKNANDTTNALGEELAGNKMDSNNLATVFAPNILHCIKPGSKDTQDRSEDRLDVINVVRILIDHYKQIFTVSAELLDEIYCHMVDSYPEVLEQILNKKDALAGADESVDELDSESNSAPWTPTHPSSEVSTEYAFEIRMHPGEPKKTYSREECLHESAATGGPNIGMRIRHKDKIRDRSLRRKREKYEDGLLSRIRGSQKDEEFFKTRSSSIESTSSAHTEDVSRALRMSDAELHQRRKSSPYILDNSGVLTASLTIPVQAGISYNIDDDIPYIEDVENGRQHMTIGVVKAPAVPRRRHTSVGSDSSIASNALPVTGSLSLCQGYDSAIGSSAPTTYSSPHQNTPTSVNSSIADQSHFSSPPSWTSSPPTSPDSVNTSVNYIPDEVNVLKPAPKDRIAMSAIKEGPMIQKVSFAQSPSPQTIQKVRDLKAMYATCSEITKSASATSFAESKIEREPRFTPSITSIGNAVLKSKTAEFERMMKTDSKPKAQAQTVSVTVSASVTNTASTDKDKKKYTKRRYTDTRHPTRHIPDSESLEAASNKSEASVTTVPAAGPVYKRREIISSVHTK